MRTKVKFFAVIALLHLVSACSTSSQQVTTVVDADTQMVQSCRFIGTFSGTSGWGGVVASVGISNAQNEVRIDAASKGANRIVWNSMAGGWAPSVSGNAYQCP